MYIRNVRVADLTPEHLQSLLDQRTPESVTLDYKRDYELAGDESRRELLADVSAMANTQGGVILYGVEEERDANNVPTGIPSNFTGIRVPNEDALRLALLSCIHDGLSPRVRGVQAQVVRVNGKALLALGVPRSLERPHAVWFKQNGKFYRRRDTGKYQVDVSELRVMFNERETWEEAADSFRSARIDALRRRYALTNTPPQFVALHILPLGRLRERIDLIGDANPHQRLQQFLPEQDASTALARGVLEGLLLPGIRDYPIDDTLLFNFAGLEYVTAKFFSNEKYHGRDNAFFLGWVVDLVNGYCPRAIRAMSSELLVEPPYVVYLTILGAAKVAVFARGNDTMAMRTTFSDNELMFPASIVDDPAPDAARFEPLVKLLWQAAGALR